jgi:hypothetical protein
VEIDAWQKRRLSCSNKIYYVVSSIWNAPQICISARVIPEVARQMLNLDLYNVEMA